MERSAIDTPRPRPTTRRFLLIAVVAVGAGLGWQAWSSRLPAEHAVTLESARAAHEAGQAVLIDIREPAEHARGVAAGARLLPLSQLGQRLQEIPNDPARPVLLICQTQNRSGATLRRLHAQGYSHVRYVHGGMSEWMRRGWPTVPPMASTR